MADGVVLFRSRGDASVLPIPYLPSLVQAGRSLLFSCIPHPYIWCSHM